MSAIPGSSEFLRAFWEARKNQKSLRTGESYDLGKMSLPALWMAYLTYPTILLYFVIIVCSAGLALTFGSLDWHTLLAILAVVLVYPFAWYAIHRFILHARWPYKNPYTAALWKRVHFDHHQNPHLLDVLFGSPLTTLPTIALVAMPIGWLINGVGTSFTALATGVVMTCIYEFFHCIQHLAYKPKSQWVTRIKQLHVLHHYHNEDGNYGITNYAADRLFRSLYKSARACPRSEHVFDLGYDIKEAQIYPWVMEHTGAPPTKKPRKVKQPDAAL